jgi:tRNA A37 threonylcarbamoyladenosine synthetase subunit TsaC/SUA5/YrdC
VHEGEYFGFLKKFGWLYSTSANRSGGKFDFDFASKAANEIIGVKDSFSEKAPSKIIKIGKKPKRLR